MSQTGRFLGPLSLAAAWLICSCSAARDSASSDAQYYLVSVNTRVPYWQTAGAGFARAAGELGVKASLTGPETYDPKAEQEELKHLIALRPAGILISPADPDLMKSDIDAALAAGIPIITVDADSPSSKRLSFIGTDNYEAGRMGAEILSRSLQGNGNVAIFTMPGQTNLGERYRGYMEILTAYPHITLLPVVDIKGDPQIAYDQTKKLLSTPKSKVDAFVCLDALGCKGVAKALSEAHIEGKTVIAMDSDPETLDWIRKGVILGTIAQRPFTMGFVGLKMLDELHRHQPRSLSVAWSKDPYAPVPSFVNTGVIWIDKQNADAFLRPVPAS